MAMRKMEDMLDNLIRLCEDCRKDANKFDRLGTIAAAVRLRKKVARIRVYGKSIRANVQEVRQARKYLQKQFEADGIKIEDAQ